MLKIIAGVVLIVCVLDVVLVPFFFGKKRDPYSKGTWIETLIQALFVIPLCLKVLGVF